MNKNSLIQNYFKEYKFNKARIHFLQNQIMRLSDRPDPIPKSAEKSVASTVKEEGGHTMIPHYYPELRSAFQVRESESVYSDQNGNVVLELEQELNLLRTITGIVEDSLNMLEEIDRKYRVIIEEHYINGNRMENVADIIHISRSRCYDLRSEAIRWVARVVFGEEANRTTAFDIGAKEESAVCR